MTAPLWPHHTKMTTLTHLRAVVLSRSTGNASSSSTGRHGVCSECVRADPRGASLCNRLVTGDFNTWSEHRSAFKAHQWFSTVHGSEVLAPWRGTARRLTSYLSACKRHFGRASERRNHSCDQIWTSCARSLSWKYANEQCGCSASAFSKFPREPPGLSAWSQHMLLLLLRPPGRLSWENTEPGPGSAWPQILALWTPKDPWGPSGFKKISHWSWRRGDVSNRHDRHAGSEMFYCLVLNVFFKDFLKKILKIHNIRATWFVA